MACNPRPAATERMRKCRDLLNQIWSTAMLQRRTEQFDLMFWNAGQKGLARGPTKIGAARAVADQVSDCKSGGSGVRNLFGCAREDEDENSGRWARLVSTAQSSCAFEARERRDNLGRGVTQRDFVRALVFGSLFRDRPRAGSEVGFLPLHAGHFVAARARQQEQSPNGAERPIDRRSCRQEPRGGWSGAPAFQWVDRSALLPRHPKMIPRVRLSDFAAL